MVGSLQDAGSIGRRLQSENATPPESIEQFARRRLRDWEGGGQSHSSIDLPRTDERRRRRLRWWSLWPAHAGFFSTEIVSPPSNLTLPDAQAACAADAHCGGYMYNKKHWNRDPDEEGPVIFNFVNASIGRDRKAALEPTFEWTTHFKLDAAEHIRMHSELHEWPIFHFWRTQHEFLAKMHTIATEQLTAADFEAIREAKHDGRISTRTAQRIDLFLRQLRALTATNPRFDGSARDKAAEHRRMLGKAGDAIGAWT